MYLFSEYCTSVATTAIKGTATIFIHLLFMLKDRHQLQSHPSGRVDPIPIPQGGELLPFLLGSPMQ